MRIRAAVLNEMGAPAPYAQSKPLKIETIELDPPGPGEILVKIAAAGLCHSDLSVIEGNRPRPMPMALGHEAAGVVEELGPGRRRPREGRPRRHGVRAELRPLPALRGGTPGPVRARAPPRTAPARCSPARGASTATARTSTTISACSGFAEYATISRRSCVKVDRELPLDEAALFGCAVLTGVGAVINTAKVPAGHDGRGRRPRRRRPELDPRRRRLGREPRRRGRPLGREARARPPARRDRHLQRRRRPTPSTRSARRVKGGVEYAFEMAGSVRALELAYKITRRGGTTVTAGLPPPTHTLRAVAGQPRRRGAHAQRAATSAPACRCAICRATSTSTGAASCRSTG